MATRNWTDAVYRTVIRFAYPVARVWWHLTKPTVHGAHVILRRKRPDGGGEDEILAIRNSYKPAVSTPCGQIKRGEQPIAGALRELLEEVGIRLPPDRLLDGGEIFLIDEGRRDHSHFFECRLEPEEDLPIQIDHREVVWAGFLPESELLSLHLTPHLRRYLEGSDSAGRRASLPRENTQSGSAS